MAKGADLNGVWTGHYFQHGRAAPIRAELRQEGERLSGTMRDVEVETVQSIEDLAAEVGLPPGADERIVAWLREMLPEAEGRPIRYQYRLPPESALEGAVRGEEVAFLKTYRGEASGGFRVGEHFVGETRTGHSVHYRGRLDPEGWEIEGEWWIDPTPEEGGRRLEGLFVLRREA